jgi:hypothetical protein
MRKIKALIYAILGGMVGWAYWQRGDTGLAVFIVLFTVGIIALMFSSLGKMRLSWDKEGISLTAFPRKPKLIHWEDLEKVSSDHLGYHVQATSGRFKIRKATMPENLLKRIKENIRLNQERRR